MVTSGPVFSPALSAAGTYYVGQTVTAAYECKDALSGVVKCGASTYTTPVADTGTLTSPVDTSKPGSPSFTVIAIDAAGNQVTASANYQVVQAPPVNLALLNLAALKVKSGAQLTYLITAANVSKNAATSVTITDPLPAGLTFVKATASQLVCANGKCSNQASCDFTNNTVSCTAPALTALTPIVATVTVQVTASTGTKIQNTATVTSANPTKPQEPRSPAQPQQSIEPSRPAC